MRYNEVDVLGVLVSPLAPMLLLAWLALLPLRWLLIRTGVLARAWHPALLVLGLYGLLASAVVIAWPLLPVLP
jgi:hypothetical protein